MTTESNAGVGVPRTSHSLTDWPVSSLLLDIENPRLPPSQKALSQVELLTLIVRLYSVTELMDSFAINGYFDEEPLVGVPAKGDPPKLIIVEGNRRLAALKLLLEPSLATQLVDSASGRPLRVNMPKLSDGRRKELQQVPVRVYEEGRSAVLAYLGYRHITGVKRWDSYAKARYVYQLVNEGNDLADIQQRIGDQHETAPRLLRAYLVWEQAVSHSIIPQRNGHSPPFSYLFTALTFRPMLTYLGLAAQGSPQPVPQKKLSELREIATFLYGDTDSGRKAAIEESREIKLLAQAVSSKVALERLRAGAKASEAVEAIPVAEARIEKMIRQVLDRLAQATDIAGQTPANDTVKRLASDCVDASQNLVKVLR